MQPARYKWARPLVRYTDTMVFRGFLDLAKKIVWFTRSLNYRAPCDVRELVKYRVPGTRTEESCVARGPCFDKTKNDKSRNTIPVHKPV